MSTHLRHEPRAQRRIVVLAVGTLAVATLSSVAPVPQVVDIASAEAPAVVAAVQTDAATLDVAAAGGVAGVASTKALSGTVSKAAAASTTAPQQRPKPVVKAKPATAVAPFRFGTAAYAQWHAKRIMASRYGWTSTAQYQCLVNLWNRESHWNYKSHNSSSGAHGIPQALPGSKMAKIAPDWRTNPVTQIRWGLGYIKGRYGTPCGAWRHFQSRNWY